MLSCMHSNQSIESAIQGYRLYRLNEGQVSDIITQAFQPARLFAERNNLGILLWYAPVQKESQFDCRLESEFNTKFFSTGCVGVVVRHGHNLDNVPLGLI